MNIRSPRVQKLILAAVLIGGVFYVYFGLTVIPFGYRQKAAKIAQLKGEYAKLSTEVTQARRLAADLHRVEALHRATQLQWERAHELIPEKTEMPGLLRHITVVGQSSGVEFVKFEPAASTAYEYYTENPVLVSVIGGYHEVGSFLSEIAALPRLVNVGKMDMKALSGGEDGETVTATFTASAYSVTSDHVRATQVTTPTRPGVAGAPPAGGRPAPGAPPAGARPAAGAKSEE